jgi:Xaa-Pro aminopeptidase
VINKKECQFRRKRLMDMIGSDGIAILPTASVHIRNRDVEFPFRPDSDFFYLTAYPEPEAVAVLIPDRTDGEFLLFCRESDVEMETWHGRRVGLEGALDIYGADDAFPVEDMDDILPGLIEGHERIFYNMGNDQNFDQKVLSWVKQIRGKARTGVVAPDEFISLNHFLHDMRLYKSRHEIKLMRQAAKISSGAHKRVMQYCKPGMHEYQLEAELVHEFMRHGAHAAAYPSIVGSGANGCILHYTENRDEIDKGDLLLIDAGAEYQGYASDITRTFPANGKFSTAQRQAYDLVLAAQLAAIEQVKPGNHWNDPHDAAVRVLTEGMIELGILKGELDELIKDHVYTKYFMHRTGHWIGMDVHDVGDYKLDGEWRMLEAGMVLTVEPGLYMPSETKGLPKKWWNIGIRIEDDVLVTKDGYEVLSRGAPKTADEIEELMTDAA